MPPPKLLAALLLLAPVVASASDGGPQVLASGLTVADPLPALVAARPLWLDSAGRAVVGDVTQGIREPLRCLAPADGGWTDLGIVVDGGPDGGYLQSAIAPGAGDAFAVALFQAGHVSVYQTSCAGPLSPGGEYDLPSGLGAGGLWEWDTLPARANGTLYYPTDGGLVALPPGGPAAPAVTPAALDAALGSADGGRWSVLGATVSPDDRLWLAVQHTDASGPLGVALLELTAAGVLRVARPLDPALSGVKRLLGWGEQAAVAIDSAHVELGYGVAFDTLGLLPLHAAADLSRPLPPWPVLAGLPASDTAFGFVRGAGGALYARSVQNVPPDSQDFTLRRLGVDPDQADFDRDGLRASVEARLGTSDWLADSDGDGAPDGLEAGLAGTDPADAGSHPPASTGDRLVYGLSTMPTDWPLGTGGGPANWFVPGPSASGVVCAPAEALCPNATSACFDVNLDPISNQCFTPRTALSPSGRYAFSASSSAITRTDLANNREESFVSASAPCAECGLGTAQIFPLSDEALAVAAQDFWGSSRVVVVTRSDRQTFLDLDRAGCPLLGSAADLARCGAPDLAAPELGDRQQRTTAPLGVDPARGALLLGLRSARGRHLVAVTERGATLVGDLTDLASGLMVGSLSPARSGGYVASVGVEPQSGTSALAGYGALRLDANLRPLPLPQAPFPPKGTWFLHGFYSTFYESFLTEPPVTSGSAGCYGDGLITVCGGSLSPPADTYLPKAFGAEFVPVGPAVQPGEVLMAASQRYFESRATPWIPGEGSAPIGPHWALWRVTPVGATVEWLGEAGFAAATDAAGRASLATTPLGPATALRVAPDGLHLCLVEPGAGRLWELSLDASSRELASVALRGEGGITACAYDGSGALAQASSAGVAVGGRTLAWGGSSAPSGLLRIAGGWLVAAHDEDARCVGDDGSVRDVGRRIRALGAAPGGAVALVDGDGKGYVASPEALCAGQAPEERLHHPAIGFWDAVVNPTYTQRLANSDRGSLLVRPDGLLLAAPRGLGFNGATGSKWPEYLFRLYPLYRPDDWGHRLSALDPFRREQVHAQLMALWPAQIEAMDLVPGAPASADWGHLGPAPAPVTAPDAGPAADAGPPVPHPPAKKGCGCDAGGSAPLALLLLLGVRRRRS